MSELLTVSREKAEEIKAMKYFPFSIIWIPSRPRDTVGRYYVKTSEGINSPEYFAELLAERAVNNDDQAYDLKVATILGIEAMFTAKYTVLNNANKGYLTVKDLTGKLITVTDLEQAKKDAKSAWIFNEEKDEAHQKDKTVIHFEGQAKYWQHFYLELITIND